MANTARFTGQQRKRLLALVEAKQASIRNTNPKAFRVLIDPDAKRAKYRPATIQEIFDKLESEFFHWGKGRNRRRIPSPSQPSEDVTLVIEPPRPYTVVGKDGRQLAEGTAPGLARFVGTFEDGTRRKIKFVSKPFYQYGCYFPFSTKPVEDESDDDEEY